MKYKLIIFDIDGTITTHISSWRYIHEKLGIWDALAERYQEKFFAGKISYKKFCELDAAHWKGLPVKKVENIFKKVRYSKNIIPSIKILKSMGFKLVAISTGLQFMADIVKKELGFDYVLSNRLNVRNGKLTGTAHINIAHGAKGKTVKKILKIFKVKPQEAIAIGDTDGDIPMAKIAGYSIAFNSYGKLLPKVVDYNCKNKDFKVVLKKIISISGGN
jgi:phosphoserine phosphatase